MCLSNISRTGLLLPLVLALCACVNSPPRKETQTESSKETESEISFGDSTAIAVPQQTKEETTDSDSTQTAEIALPEEASEPTTETVPTPPVDNIWTRLRSGFVLDKTHPHVQRKVRWYAENPDYMRRVQTRARPFLFFILEEARKRELPHELALLPVVESAFQPFAYSPRHASGLWQFMPSTGSHFGLRQDWWYDGRRDILASTRAALDYLDSLHRYYKGSWELALAAYNAGQGTVNRAIRRNKKNGDPTDFWSLKLPQETRAYVPRLLAFCQLIASPDTYGISLQSIPERPYFTEIGIVSQLDLTLAAEMADISIDELYRLNPGFNRWATAPDESQVLLVPLDRAEEFQARLAKLDPEEHMRWKIYPIQSGDSLSSIAQRHGTTVSHLKQINQLKSLSIRAGGHLLIPRTRSDQDLVTRIALNDRADDLSRHGDTRPPLSYTVRPGDTLWGIGRTYSVSLDKLAQWNELRPEATLFPKQKLVIWQGASN